MDARGVVAVLDGLLAERNKPCFIRLDNGPEFIATVLEDWCEEVGVQLYFIEPAQLSIPTQELPAQLVSPSG